MDIKTVKEFRKAVKDCREVRIGVRFGVADAYVKIAKADALKLVKGWGGNTTGRELEMYTGDFGRLEDGILYAG